MITVRHQSYSLPGREFTNVIRTHYGNTPICGAEVGVAGGDNAVNTLIGSPNITMLYLVDAYDSAITDDDFTDDMDYNRKMAVAQLLPFTHRVKWMMTSSEIASEFIPHKLHFVYLDASHTFDNVCNDINTWFKLILPGGIISGHDYPRSGVSNAVRKFVTDNDLISNHSDCKSQYDWWIFKPFNMA